MDGQTVSFTLTALPGMPLVQTGDNLVTLILEAVQRTDLTLQTGDVLVVTSKIVSKAEGRIVDLQTVTPSAEALQLAEETHKDSRVVELILQESQSISRKAPHVLIVQHRLGFISANAGIDQSNVGGGQDRVLLLPKDPDASAQAIRAGICDENGADIGVVISDSHGRPFRLGTVGVAIGVAGLPSLLDLRGQHDLFGRELQISMQGYADMVASSAQLIGGEGAEGLPVVLIRGLNFPPVDGAAHDVYRAPEQDLYR